MKRNFWLGVITGAAVAIFSGAAGLWMLWPAKCTLAMIGSAAWILTFMYVNNVFGLPTECRGEIEEVEEC